MADLKRIAADLGDELDELDNLVSRLTEERWGSPTPAEPWTVRDRTAHEANLVHERATNGDVRSRTGHRDGLGTRREPTDRLRHVAHIGVRAREYSYVANGLTAPTEAVRVAFEAPSGELWTWKEDGAESVTGPGYDFCLVVTRRRHVGDTALTCSGPNAEQWMSIAQAYAGPPGEGRSRGQFRKE